MQGLLEPAGPADPKGGAQAAAEDVWMVLAQNSLAVSQELLA